MIGPLDDRPLVVQVAWLAQGFSIPDIQDVARLLECDPADPALLDAWRAAGLPESAGDAEPW